MKKKRSYFYKRVKVKQKLEPIDKFKFYLAFQFKLFISTLKYGFTKTLPKFLIVILLILITLPPSSSALFSDQEKTAANQLSTSTLDLEILTHKSNFESEPLMPGKSATQNALLINAGKLAFAYSQEITNLSNSPLCENLILKSWYYYYDNLGNLQKKLKYNGILTNYSINSDSLDSEMINPNSNSYFTNPDYGDKEHWYYYELSLPDSAKPSLGSQTCSFDILTKAWQEDLAFDVGFWDQEVLSFSITTGIWAKVSGMKFNDLDGNGTKDDQEPGLPDWTIYAAKQFEKFNVLATGEGYETKTLESNRKYMIRVKGTFSAGDAITADAKYSINTPDLTDWTDTVKNYESYGSELLDLQINGSSPDWGVFADNHEYWLNYEGENEILVFDIFDIYSDNNSGSLEVTIFEAALTDDTDENGYYEIDFSSLEGEIIIAEEPQSGWQQTYPAKGIYSLATNKLYSEKDFGNTKVPETPDLAKIVINEVYYDVDSAHGSESGSQSDEWIELYNPNDFDINLKDWTIQDNGNTRTISHSAKYIPAHGFAVIAKAAQTWTFWTIPDNAATIELGQEIGNGLSNDGDRLILKNPDGQIIDQISWGSDGTIHDPSISDVLEGHSIVRSPLGLDTDLASDWVDNSIPNPGTNPHSHIQVSINQEDNNLIIGFSNAYGFDLLDYLITYNHVFDGAIIKEAVQGQKTKSFDQKILILSPIYLGTCSTNGIVCKPHLNIQDMIIELNYNDGKNTLGKSTINYIWQ